MRALEINPGQCFVAMPFDEKWDELWRQGIEAPLKELKFKPYRVDQQNLSAEEIIKHIKTNIFQSEYLIADISEDNPNVFYEVGLAHACKKPLVLLCNDHSQAGEKIFPFDIRHLYVKKYETVKDVSNHLLELFGPVVACDYGHDKFHLRRWELQPCQNQIAILGSKLLNVLRVREAAIDMESSKKTVAPANFLPAPSRLKAAVIVVEYDDLVTNNASLNHCLSWVYGKSIPCKAMLILQNNSQPPEIKQYLKLQAESYGMPVFEGNERTGYCRCPESNCEACKPIQDLIDSFCKEIG